MGTGTSNMSKHVLWHLNAPITLTRQQLADALEKATAYGEMYGKIKTDHFNKILPIKKKHQKKLEW